MKYNQREILVTTENGEEFVVRIDIPTANGTDEWKYICDWIDKHIKDAKEWK